MSRNWFALTIFVAGVILLGQFGCQESGKAATRSETAGQTAAAVQQAQPKVGFEKLAHDFGEVGPETMNSCEFKFTNTGDAVLKIGKIDATCGCTVPQLSKDEYAPGESGTIVVNYHADKQLGPTTKRLFVPTNDQATPTVDLTIKAKIVEKVRFEPKNITLLPHKADANCPNITITSLDNEPFAIKDFRSVPDCITADIDYSAKATTFVLGLKVDVEKLRRGPDNGRIEIGLTHPGLAKVSIPFNVLPKFKVSPPAIVIFDAKPDAPVKKDVWVLSNYNEDFEIETTSSQKGIIKVLSQEKIDKRYKFELEITAPAVEGNKPKIFTDIFTVYVKGGEKLEVTCRGFYPREKTGRAKPAGRG